MAKSRSFKEYVEKHFDNELYNAVSDFLEETDPSELDLRLNKVTDIGRIEPDYDTEVQFVNVEDGPDNRIKFDVVLNVPLIVYDSDIYHNDQTDYANQWFTCKCEGDLSSNLADMTINEVRIYSWRDKTDKPLSDSLVPIIYKNQLDQVAAEFLRKYYPEALEEPMWIDPGELANRMNLNVITQHITKDMSVFGQIYFRDSMATVYDEQQDAMKEIDAPRGTVLVDPEVFFQRNLGAYNNTVVHECVHWALHQKAFELERLFNEDVTQIRCEVIGGIKGGNDSATKWMEWQANSLAPRIQMPLKQFKRKAAERISYYQDQLEVTDLCELMPCVIDDLAEFFMVSRTAAKIRMIDVGYEEAAGAFIYIDGEYVQPYTYKKGAIKQNQTYSIPAEDAARESLVNPLLQKASGYLYIDSHFVLNHPKYVCKDNDGRMRLTDYARHHVDECCLAFDMSIRGDEGEYYHSECFLDRDKNSPADFDIKFTGENGELDDESRNELIRETIMEEADILEHLPNDYTKAWNQVLEWRGISKAELSRRTGITEKTIGEIINRKSAGTLESVVLMCLGANLPWNISSYLMQRSGYQLVLSNVNHRWYQFALQYMYTKGVGEIREFLHQFDVYSLG